MTAAHDLWQLEIKDEFGSVRIVPLEAERLIIGRAVDADIRLDRQSVSREHANLVRDASGSWRIFDVGSRGGIAVNGQRVEQASLLHDDTIAISRFQLRVIAPRATKSPASATRPAERTWAHEPGDHEISILTKIESPRLDMSHISALSEFGRELMTIESPAARLTRLCEVMAGKIIRARWAMALRVDPDDVARPAQQLAVYPPTSAQQDLHLSRSAIASMRAARAPVLATNFRQSSGAAELSIVAQSPATAVVVVGLTDDPQSPDLLYVNLPPVYGSTEWLALIALAVKQYQQAESTWAVRETTRIQAARERDLANARQIQRSILPKPAASARITGLDIAWSFEPCDLVGGDLVDIVPMRDGRILLTIADVTGHGLPAALATLAVHSIIHVCVATDMPLPLMMQHLNEHLCDYLPEGRFVTMVALAIDPATGDMQCLNAGHPSPLILRPGSEPRAMQEAAHLPLGVDRFTFEMQSDRLAHDEVLFLSTDGLTELPTPNGPMLGTPGVTKLLTDTLARSPLISTAALAFRTQLEHAHANVPAIDDQTFLLARRK